MEKVIGVDLTICNYSTKQKGYGRQALYFEFEEIKGSKYIQDVFPNIIEGLDILLSDDAFYNEEKGYYTDGNGNGEYKESEIYNTIIEALQDKFNGRDIEIDEDED